MNFTPVISYAHQRHNAYLGEDVTDPVVRCNKFTNVFRVLDRGSQYLLNLMNQQHELYDRFALSYFYRQVNRPDTMEAIIGQHGATPGLNEITDPDWLESLRPLASQGDFLSGAYMILIKVSDSRGTIDKMKTQFPNAKDTLLEVSGVKNLEERVSLLQTIPGLGPFLSMQIATDMGYCEGEPDQENTFILPGPGSIKGVAAMLEKPTVSRTQAEEVIRLFPTELMPTLPGSNGRPPSLMDIQNVFCEYGKYVRYHKRPNRYPYRRKTPHQVHIPKQFILNE